MTVTRYTITASPTKRHPQGVIAFVELTNNYCTDCPPVLKFMRGWPKGRLSEYCEQRGWAFAEITEA